MALKISSSKERFVASSEAMAESARVSSRSLTSALRTVRAARSPSAMVKSAFIESVEPTLASCRYSDTSLK